MENTMKHEALKEDEIKSAKSQMNLVREENTKLKTLLHQIETDYKSLQMRYSNVVRHESNKNNESEIIAINEDIEEHDFVSLRLGRSSSTESKKEDIQTSHGTEDQSKDGLKLGLDCNFSGTEVQNKSPGLETKEDEQGGDHTWPPSKVLKTIRSGDDEITQPAVKRARVSVRARCDAPTLNDGCQWRKYGQKISKGNPCPRAYYRCTVAPSCPVRKQVQRCCDDMSILITTYEGTHNHPLPMSATAMASTTSAAASMLLSGSSTTSQSGFGPSPTPPTINLGGLGLNLTDNSKTRPFYFPSSSIPQFPTITLDLTSNPSTSSTHFNMFPSNFQRYPSTSLNFASPESSMVPSVWSNGYSNYKTNSSQQALTDTLTKAITSDPSIQSVIAAAISSMVAGGSAQAQTPSSPSLKWAEHIQVLNSNPLNFLNQTTSLDSQNGNLRLLPHQQTPLPLAFSISNSSSRSTVDNGDQTN